MIETNDIDGRTEILLSRPERANALSMEMVEGLSRAIDQAEASNASCIVFKGEGKHFCSGFDLSLGTDEVLSQRFHRLESLLARVAYSDIPTVACVAGAAIGAGADLVTSCTFRLGTATAFFRFPGPRFGVVLGAARLKRVVGLDNAYRLLLLQESVRGPDALKMGLLSDLYEEAAQLDEAVIQIAHRLRKIEAPTRRSVLDVIRTGNPKEELGDLARSTARPGLAERLGVYLNDRD